MEQEKKIRKPGSGGVRPNSGRPRLVNSGIATGINIEKEDLALIKQLFPGLSTSSFYRAAGRHALNLYLKKQLVLKFE
jgi:hypothetical protein